MARFTTPTDDSGIVRRILARLENLERRTSKLTRPVELEVLRFSLAGAVSVAEGGPDTAAVGGAVIAVVARLGTAGTSTTTVVVKVNGTTISTLNLASGATVARDYPNERIGADVDLVTVETTAAGAGAEDLQVQVRLRG